MSFYRGYFVPGAVDPLGLWVIERKGLSQARAIAEKGDTIDSLANSVGLRPEHWGAWVEGKIFFEDGEGGIDGIVCPGTKVKVPNTIYVAWFGETNGFGKWWSGWEKSKSVYEGRGYRVQTIDWTDYLSKENHGNAAKQKFKNKFLNDIGTLSSAKELHGFSVTGHGLPTGLIIKLWKTNKLANGKLVHDWFSVSYNEIFGKLQYRLSIVHLFVCHGANPPDFNKAFNAGGKDLWSAMPSPASFLGDEGTFIPTFGASNPPEEGTVTHCPSDEILMGK